MGFCLFWGPVCVSLAVCVLQVMGVVTLPYFSVAD